MHTNFYIKKKITDRTLKSYLQSTKGYKIIHKD